MLEVQDTTGRGRCIEKQNWGSISTIFFQRVKNGTMREVAVNELWKGGAEREKWIKSKSHDDPFDGKGLYCTI